MSGSSNQFSFDVYPGLDAELQAAFLRNRDQGEASPEAVAASGLAAAVANTMEQQPAEAVMQPEIRLWAEAELAGGSDGGAIRAWHTYDRFLTTPTPTDVDALLRDHPELSEKFGRLHEAKLAIMATAGNTPEGNNAGEAMHLTLVPWQSFRDNLETLPTWIKKLRDVQGIATADDYFNSSLLTALAGDATIYRNPLAPQFFATNGTSAPDRLSAKAYLDQRIATDGPWGVLLTQTGNEAGLESLKGKSPDELTDNGQKHLEIAGHKVDGLGVFEWLAMTCQHDPRTLSPVDVSWLLANRIDVTGGAHVPCGYWYDDQVKSNLVDSGVQDVLARPRLAVI